jgi:general nucleoside transport system permease protein
MRDGLVSASIATAIMAATPVLIAATGELLAEVVGIYNIGIEGAMLIGALFAFIGLQQTDAVLLGILAGMIFGALASLLFAIAVVVFKADVVVGGLALVFLGFGLTGLIGQDYVQESASATIPEWDIPLLSDIPFWGEAFFEQMSISYLAFLFPVAAMFLLYRTQHGLNMRAIGENPGAADATGLSVNGWRIFYVSVGGAFAGLGGAVLTLGIVGTWLPNVTAGQGWIALAVVIFASWRPLPLIAGALLFGGLGTFGNVAQVEGWSITPEFFTALPYVGTLLLVYLLALLRIRRGGGAPWPAALGLPFFRGTD